MNSLKTWNSLIPTLLYFTSTYCSQGYTGPTRLVEILRNSVSMSLCHSPIQGHLHQGVSKLQPRAPSPHQRVIVMAPWLAFAVALPWPQWPNWVKAQSIAPCFAEGIIWPSRETDCLVQACSSTLATRGRSLHRPEANSTHLLFHHLGQGWYQEVRDLVC
jgi:hypothetical protein